MSSSFSSLPVELIYYIFAELKVAAPTERALRLCGKLGDDPGEWQTALAACSLVSRRWRDIAQPVLFENPVVTLRNIYSTCGKTWAEFEEFIEAPTSRRLVKSIRTLTLIPQRRPADIAASPRSRPAMLEVDPYVLPALAAKLPRLSKLFLCNVTFGHPRPDDLPLIAPVLPKINELFISSHVDFPVFVLSDLWFLVQSFPNVHALTFRGMSLDSGARRSNILRLPLLPGLKQLDVLDCSDVVCLLDDLRVAIKEQRLPVLGGLSMGCIDKRNTVQPIKDVLDILGGRLSVLALQCDAGLLVPPSFELRAGLFANLVHLRLKLCCWHCALTVVLRLADQSSLSALETLTIEPITSAWSTRRGNSFYNCYQQSGTIPSPALLAIPTLNTVAISLPDVKESSRAAEREYILTAFADLDAKGMLVII